jgi:hypothetical protein
MFKCSLADIEFKADLGFGSEDPCMNASLYEWDMVKLEKNGEVELFCRGCAPHLIGIGWYSPETLFDLNLSPMPKEEPPYQPPQSGERETPSEFSMSLEALDSALNITSIGEVADAELLTGPVLDTEDYTDEGFDMFEFIDDYLKHGESKMDGRRAVNMPNKTNKVSRK